MYLVIIIFVGFALRIWGINFGLPYQLHQDEPIIINHALAYGSGDLNPHFFIIPPFCSYILFILYGIYYILGRAFGMFAHIDDFALQFFANSGAFYLIARIALGIIPGMLSVWLCYLLYKRLFSEKGAIYAAVIMAFSFLCVVNSHYAYVDNIMVVFILATYIFLFKLIQKAALKNYVISAIFLGLAASVKYNAILLIFTLYIAHIIATFNNRFDKKRIILDKYLYSAIFIFIITFIITNPFSLLDWRAFFNDVPGKIRREYVGWVHHLAYSLYEGIGLGLLTAGILGLIAIILKEKRMKAIFFISFPSVFYAHLAIKSQLFSRYALPLIPFLAIAASYLIFEILIPKTKSHAYRLAAIIISIMLIAPTLLKSIKADIIFSRKDTRIACAEWIEANIPPYTKIAVDHTSFRPVILQTREQILDKYAIVNSQHGLEKAKEKKLNLLLQAIADKKTYNIYFLTSKNKKKVQFLSTVPAIGCDINSLLKNGISYVVINYNAYNDAKSKFIDELSKKADIVIEFSPYYDKKIRHPYDNIDATYIAISSKELFARRFNGPCFVIYKLKSI